MDEFIQEVKAFSFVGRINRLRYWKYGLFMWIVSLVVNFIMGKLGVGAAISGIVSVALAVIGLPFSVRRIHDLNKSGLWLLLCLIPVINFFFLIYISFFKGTDGNNDFGADPLEDYEAAREGRKAGVKDPVIPVQAPKPPKQAENVEDVKPTKPAEDVKDVKPAEDVQDVKPAKSAEPVPPVVPVAAAPKQEAAPEPEVKPEPPVAPISPVAKPEPPAQAAKPAVCPGCGAPIEAGSKFCGNCGSKL